ncbi:hypothetical protein FOCC_FOCC014646 [Frankliniella occidentalis]|nr:hypothetical protein FOCC_FOCC014646 [Frankliniella occidentalis]
MKAKYPFLKPDPHDPYKCICKLCNGKPFRSESYDIDRHTKGAGHTKKAEIVNPKTQKNPLEKKVKYAELKLARYVAPHD